MNFTFEGLEQARATVDRLREFMVRAEHALASMPAGNDDPAEPGDDALGLALRRAVDGFRAALDDDVNSAGALGHLFTLVREANSALDRGDQDRASLRAAVDWVREVDAIWQILPEERLREVELEHAGRTVTAVGPAIDPALKEKVLDRVRARLDRDFEAADRLRDELAEQGVELEDTADGVRWRLARRTG